METIKLTTTGDLFTANLTYNIGFGIASQFHIHKGNPWQENLAKIFKGSDISFANLESPLIEEKLSPHKRDFAGSEKFANFLQKIKINIVSIANNHILEQGEHGFNSTIKHLEQNDIKYIDENINNNSNIVFFNIKKTKLAFAGFNAIHDIDNPNLYTNFNEEAIIETINEMISQKEDYKIISLHWGNEY